MILDTVKAADTAQRSRGRRTARLGALGTLGLTILVLVAAILLWQLGTTLNPSVYFPAPSVIAAAAGALFFSGDPATLFVTDAVSVDVFSTLWRLLLGFVIGSAVGIGFGAAIGRSRALREVSDPIVEFLRAIPATATLPLFIILMGGEDAMRVAFIAYGTMWFVLINTARGVASVHPTLIDMGHIFRLPKAVVLFKIVLPAASPKIFAGLRIALTAALLLAVVSELLVATNGIGYRLVQAQASFNLVQMWAWMVALAVLGFLLNAVLEAVERRALRWDTQARG
ncbi:ABC transporter permease [Microbacterium allomyrinae]|uniref:ABC transporter permease n=1 Tax=Microbacterium allomyrinae TaxID=2830666 RepID=A0A9X1S2Y2_9MICO|nr:ABC transporter permease [Microbacterium allomyrinae]MCC2033176.1 ABC transporter permease [Microbacterium allomyrinae]